jgi:hypothetical protein
MPESSSIGVFLNIPYDEGFDRLFLAYVAGLSHLGLHPHMTLELPSSRNRREKILGLICKCSYSIHDLSRVQLDQKAPRTPRFNMPFELGLTVACAEFGLTADGIGGKEKSDPKDSWFVFEAMDRRLSKSLSDLGGSDPHIHHGTIEGVMRGISNIFIRGASSGHNSVPEMMRTYRALSRSVEDIKRQAGAKSLYEARVFGLLCTAATKAVGIQQTR